jgi:hypothetical protein
MIMFWIARVGIFLQPEEMAGPMDPRPGYRRTAGQAGKPGISVKALFWCAAAIVLSLALGNLN